MSDSRENLLGSGDAARATGPCAGADRHRGVLDFLPIFGSVLVWGIAPILIAVIGKAGFDPYAQSFYRYAAAAVFLLAIAAVQDRPGLAAAFRRVRATGAMALAMVAFQFAYVYGIYFTTPTIAVFAEHSSVVFGLTAGAILFADERPTVFSWRFLTGAAIVAAAAVGVILGGEPRLEGGPVREASTAVGGMCLFAAAAAWAALALLIKHSVGHERIPACRTGGRRTAGSADSVGPSKSAGRSRPLTTEKLAPLPAVAVTMAEATLLVLAATAIFGDLGHVTNVSGGIIVMLVASGAACVGVGQALYFVSIRRVGVAFSQTVTLATPFVTGLFSFTFLGERMVAFQWACGTVLMGGVAYLTSARSRPRPPSSG